MSACQIITDFEFNEDTHETTVDGERVLSVTQIIEAADLTPEIQKLKAERPEVVKRKAQLGKLVHAACHYYDENDLGEIGNVEVEDRLESYKMLRAATGYVPTCHETRRVVMVNGFRYSMQFDSYGWARMRPWLVDIKNTARKSPTWGIQEAAYELTLPRPAPYTTYDRVVAWLLPDRKFKILTFSDRSDYDIWTACCIVVLRPAWATNAVTDQAQEMIRRWKTNHGIGGGE